MTRWIWVSEARSASPAVEQAATAAKLQNARMALTLTVISTTTSNKVPVAAERLSSAAQFTASAGVNCSMPFFV